MNEDRVVCFIVAGNSGSLYWRMTEIAISMIRNFNQEIKIRLFFCSEPEDRIASFCRSRCVDLKYRSYLDRSYFFYNRKYLAECHESSVLHMDSDVFIFGDVNNLFEKYKNFEFVACPNDWVWSFGWNSDYISELNTPFNGGVTLFNQHLAKKWGHSIIDKIELLSDRKTYPDLSNWLWDDQRKGYNKEEFALSLFIAEGGFSYKYFDYKDCRVMRWEHDVHDMSYSTIFHCYNHNWKKCLRKLNCGNKPKIIGRKRGSNDRI